MCQRVSILPVKYVTRYIELFVFSFMAQTIVKYFSLLLIFQELKLVLKFALPLSVIKNISMISLLLNCLGFCF